MQTASNVGYAIGVIVGTLFVAGLFTAVSAGIQSARGKPIKFAQAASVFVISAIVAVSAWLVTHARQ